MKKTLFTAAILALITTVGCESPSPEDVADEVTADGGLVDEPLDAGASNGDASSTSDAASEADSAVVIGDSGALSDAGAPADAGGGTIDSAVANQDSGAADSGSAQSDAGSQAQGTVVWTKRTTTTTNLGAVGSQPYHRARFLISVNGCNLTVNTSFYATGTVGSYTLPLTSPQQACLRETFDCSVKLKVEWSSCSATDCPTLQAGPVWDVYRPACTVSLPAVGKQLSLRHTIAQLGASGIDETWEVVTP
jgi:hypothetical protein